MVARLLLLPVLFVGTRAWLGEYACENVLQFGSRADVEKCFEDRFPQPVSDLFLGCAQNSHASRAYTVLQDYCQYEKFQEEVNDCMNQDQAVTLVTQGVAFRTLRTCLDWISRTTPDQSSESLEETVKIVRKRDVDNNEIDTDEKLPKAADIIEEGSKIHGDAQIPETERTPEDNLNADTDVSTEGNAIAVTEGVPVLVTEINSVIEEMTMGTMEDHETGEQVDVTTSGTVDVETEVPQSLVTEIISVVEKVTEGIIDEQTNENGGEQNIGLTTEEVSVAETEADPSLVTEIISVIEEFTEGIIKEQTDESDGDGGKGEDTGVVTEEATLPQTEAVPSLVTEIINVIEEFTEATIQDQTDESDGNEEIDEGPGIDEKSDEETSDEATETTDEDGEIPSDEAVDDGSSSGGKDDEYDFSVDKDDSYEFNDDNYPIEFPEDDRSHESVNGRINRIRFVIYVNKETGAKYIKHF